ncbi:hypothetical protein FB45DRAFT_1063764 [Roridomyces roridus]|uniref:F-box domain-containing protein n=1 Tax=Roridomyces roridus TaxID=1738132 RepID=A0AAD7BD05_9AGAR|nr:hypothetical protein FB45DRAFT_1063764 [Roridomyces roridus]
MCAIEQLREHLAALDASISEQESVLHGLQKQRTDVLAALDLVVYPVLTLPPEITAEIFLWCIDTGKRVASSEAPLLLTQICRDWRSLAIATPALWDTIPEIEFGSTLGAPQPEMVIDTWFQRAGTRPLTLVIRYSELDDPTLLESVLHPHAPRLQDLNLMCDLQALVDFTTIPSFPILRKLVLSSMDDVEDVDDEDAQIELFRVDGTPLPSDFHLEHILPSMVVIPWAQLTKLTLAIIPHQECLDILRLVPALRDFARKHSAELAEGLSPDESMVTHPTITSLTILDPEWDGSILPCLILPQLESFKLGSRFTMYQTYSDAYVFPFLSKIAGTLRTFTVGLSPSVPLSWLDALSHLTTLELAHPMGLPFQSHVIRALDRRMYPEFLPKLRAFVFIDCPSDAVNEDLLGALDSRLAGPTDSESTCARLESFRLVWPKYPQAGQLPLVNVPALRALAQRGLRIHVGTKDQNSFY